MERPNYYANIPADVRYSDIPANAKLLYGEITALANKEGFCWASNPYFAKLYGVSVQSVSKWISELNKRGFIRCFVSKEDGNARKIYLNTSSIKVVGGIKENFNSYTRKVEHINTINNTFNNTSKSEYENLIEEPINEKPRKVVSQRKLLPFAAFWELYPKKQRAKEANAVWYKLDKETQQTILLDLPKRIKTKQWKDEDGKYIPSPVNYLQGERWLDQLIIPKPPKVYGV